MRKRLLFGFSALGALLLTGCVPPVDVLQAVITTTPGPAQGEYPLAVTFDASRSSGDIVEYLWTFGDGATGSGVISYHTYRERGTYPVFLTVVDRSGATHQAQTTVSVHSKRPIAQFTISPSAFIRAGEEVTFNASASYDPDGTVAEYLWDFGGAWRSTSLATVTHTFPEPGQYTVTLIVKDNEGVLSDPAMRIVPVSRGGCCGN